MKARPSSSICSKARKASRRATSCAPHKFLQPVRKPSQMCGEGFLFGRETCLGGPPNFCGFDSIFGCLLDGYYTVHYVPPPISRNALTLKDLLLTTRGVWT